MDNVEKILKRLESQYKSYEKEVEDDEGFIDISLACSLADSVPYLIKTIRDMKNT